MTGIAAPKPEEMFADADSPKDVALKFEAFKEALNEAPNTHRGDVRLESNAQTGGQMLVKSENAAATLTRLLDSPDVGKAVGADLLSSVRTALDAARESQGDIVKDFTLTSPLSTGYVAYDLEAPAKMLTPRPTPLRNKISRGRGFGTSHRFKRITGHTGTGTGGVGIFRPGITDSTTNTFGSLNYLRGPTISYAGDESNVPYLPF